MKTTSRFALKHSCPARMFQRALLMLPAACLAAAVMATDPSSNNETKPAITSAAVNAHPSAGEVAPGSAVAEVAQWVTETHDNGALPYLIIDKINAEVFAFDATGRLQSAAPALLGLARGDRSVEGVGNKEMAAIKPQERITPAGRFLASLSRDSHGKEILWVDYKNAIALHPVVKGTPQERRAERLASPTPADNRISYGCINVPAAFYENFVSPAFRQSNGIVYILPETSPASAYFGFSKHGADEKPSSPIILLALGK